VFALLHPRRPRQHRARQHRAQARAGEERGATGGWQRLEEARSKKAEARTMAAGRQVNKGPHHGRIAADVSDIGAGVAVGALGQLLLCARVLQSSLAHWRPCRSRLVGGDGREGSPRRVCGGG